MDFDAATAILKPQLLTVALNDYLCELTDSSIQEAIVTEQTKSLRDMIRVRTSIPSRLGIREDNGNREQIQVAINTMTRIFNVFFPSGIEAAAASSKEELDKRFASFAIQMQNIPLGNEFCTALAAELNKHSSEEV
jgi:hypothetical protein